MEWTSVRLWTPAAPSPFQQSDGAPPNYLDWYMDLDSVLPYIEDKFNKQGTTNILHLGCGRSQLSHELMNLHPDVNVANIDTSSLLIRKLRTFHAKREGPAHGLSGRGR